MNEEEPSCIRAREARKRNQEKPHRRGAKSQEIIFTDGAGISMASRHVIWFWEKVQKTEGCWRWIGSTWDNGYGRMMVGKRRRKAHRISFLIHNGFLPEDKVVCHTCDNPICVNPAHLFLGTQKDNNDDKVKKKRHGWGERNGRAKLTEEIVTEIRSLHASGSLPTYEEIGALHGVSKKTINHIITNATWKHLL